MYLQVALYCRHDLNLRYPTNLLLAFASLYRPCRPYLPRYFSACLNIPADWISVADYVQTFYSDKVSEARTYISPGNNETEKQVKNEEIITKSIAIAKSLGLNEERVKKDLIQYINNLKRLQEAMDLMQVTTEEAKRKAKNDS